jgi:hypothetical protein
VDQKLPWLRRALPFLGLLIVAGLIYDGVIFYSRWNGNRQAEQAQKDQQVNQARKAVEAMGGGGLKILSFYAAPGTIKRGEHTSLCYGVTGAKTVRLEPAVEEVWPALTRCVQASPRKDTEYKFIADDGAGHSTTESIAVHVR